MEPFLKTGDTFKDGEQTEQGGQRNEDRGKREEG